jgi:signal transduction histidine kinase/CheY-like chemotaxis protein
MQMSSLPSNSCAGCVLVFAPIGRDAHASAELFRRLGLQAEVCADFDSLLNAMSEETAAVVITEEGLFGKDLSDLFSWVRRQHAWSDLPFVVLTGSITHPAIAAWRQQLVSSLRNVSLLERPVQAITLTSAVQAAVRARLRQQEVRALLEARERAAAELENLVLARTHELEITNRELHTQMAERARVEDSLRQAQKIEALGQLTGGVAHDFNNLLMVITGGLDMLGRTTDPVRRQMLLDGMRQAAQRGAALTRQLLAFSRTQPLQPQPVDLARQLGGMRELLDRSLRGDVHVEYEFAEDLWTVKVDPGELELVVLNLAVNARDAMPVGGVIRIRAENAVLETDELRGDYVRLSVIDVGTGMSDDVREHVFEPFFTTKEVGKGSGLGLSQVYGFAKQSGGTVEIISQVGKGTSVVVSLPRSTQQPVADPRSVGERRIESRRSDARGFVLLVEDSDEVAALVTEMVEELGYEVTRVASAQAALGALANGRRIDLVFSDIMMPGDMNGVGLAREIRNRRSQLPVVLTSGYAEPALRDAEAEGLRVLGKPYRLDELERALSAALESVHRHSSAQLANGQSA